MERYLVIKEVGYGTFGNVWRAINKENGEIVAIKKMKKKYYCWEECMNLREVKSLRKMNHPNIVKLKEVIREHDILYFIFEYMECNLYQLMKDRDEPFSESDIRNWCFQVFQALAYMHQQGYFHRDLKPENLLLSGDVIKVADFGLAREIPSKPPFTEYVSTRWYRAPEVLLQSSVYDPAVDAWAMGAIMAELFNLRPLFPGTDEADELHKICSVIGSPNQNSWVEGLHLADAMNFQFPQYPGIHLSRLIPSASGYAISLISSLCSWNPLRRPTAAMALQHPFFKACYYIPPSLRDTKSLKTPPSASEHLNARRFSVGASTHNKLASNAPSSATYSSLRTVGGPQRKLDMYQSQDYDAPLQMQHNMPPARNNHPGCIGRVVHPNPIASSGRVADLADKLASLSMSSGPRWLAGPPPPQPAALKAGSWHSHNRHLSRPYEMPPPARGCCYPRKAVG